VEFYPSVKNKGVSSAFNVEVELVSLSTYASVNVNSAVVDTIPSRESVGLETPLSFSISANTPVEERIKLLLSTKIDGVNMSKDTISLIVGMPNYLFVDTTNNPLNLWTITSSPALPKWEATTLSYYSSPTSYTDSKSGNYNNNATVTMTLTNSINLSAFENPYLRFWTKYDIESDWDYGQVEISTNNGSSWIPLQGEYTEPGTGSFQPNGQPLYDGSKSDWVLEEISLSNYTSSQVKIRFELKTDGSQTRDGWYLDDIGIIVYTVVPVELTSFAAKIKEHSIQLIWSTATELNNYGFEIERKDGRLNVEEGKWNKIGFVNGKGSIEETSNYSFTDKTPLTGKSYYRLKQIDFDGSFKYSSAVSVEYSGVTEYELSQNYPNPFNPITLINYSIPKSGNVSLKIYNILGVEVAELINEYQEAGKHSVEFSTKSLNAEIGSGVYFYTLKAGDFVQTRKMIVVK
ncbi:MAG TPA: T9SS type A sorting domain-containing protein, partial [Ignavibacteriaceae bacterium]|nr:T9SS type A sorting domain-containing protein [Ignavibacteriaceae bacterium]